MIDDIDRLIIIYPAMMQRKNKARSTASVSSLSGHGSGYDANNNDYDDDGGGGSKKSDRGIIGGGTNNDGGGGGGGGRLRSSIVASGNAVVGGGDAGPLLELTSPATTASTTTEISPPPVITSTTKAGGSSGSSSGGGGGGGGGGGVVVLSATVKRNKCGTRPFDARWLNLDCCGLVCAGVTYALHAYGLYAFCFVLLPPWLSETDEDGYREVSERGEVEKEEKGREREFSFFFPPLFSLSSVSCQCSSTSFGRPPPCFRFYPTPVMCIYTSPHTALTMHCLVKPPT